MLKKTSWLLATAVTVAFGGMAQAAWQPTKPVEFVVTSLGARAAQDEGHREDDLPLEATIGPVESLEEPGGGDVPDPRRVLVDHRQGWPQ